jgi:hypothetical protein
MTAYICVDAVVKSIERAPQEGEGNPLPKRGRESPPLPEGGYALRLLLFIHGYLCQNFYSKGCSPLPSLPLLSFLSYGGGKRRVREE